MSSYVSLANVLLVSKEIVSLLWRGGQEPKSAALYFNAFTLLIAATAAVRKSSFRAGWM